MRERQIPVACVQLCAVDRGAFEERWDHMLAQVSSAAEHGARLIVLPEGTVPGYVLGTEPISPALLEHADASLAAIARRHGATIVYGGAKIVQHRTFNAAIALGPDGRELGFAAKQFLWHFDRLWYAPGETLEPIDTPVGRLGLLVCADGRIPTIAATLAERGAEMLVMPTAWVTSGRDPGALENIQADLMVNVRARENGIPFVACNKAGVELNAVAYCGKSTIVDAAGETHARAGERDEAMVLADVRIGIDERVERLQHATETPVDSDPSPIGGAADGAATPERLRIAFTPERERDVLVRFANFARQADADILLAVGEGEHASAAPGVPIVRVPPSKRGRARLIEARALQIALVDDVVLHDPRGLVALRAGGIDVMLWQTLDQPEWQVRFARTRAAELRAYLVVFSMNGARAFAVDPDGAVIAGTFDAYKLASFTYDRSRTQATLVAPATDVAQGLRDAERVRDTTMPSGSVASQHRYAGGGLAAPLADSSER
ncbi:MAG: hypothetical protein GIX03_12255 [Candidatus Eremiobacteraeota bacterium]|nr:hypothetical protein [Candidatus Eremiobacteraeota bacterium]MBC5803737.1 hypothetical protein [Candidatus Eremiobacteraeota bacterium]MBC5822426.1 hypothetical protein [Candidatus Eremiobacteraeota bacterium]